MVDLCPKGDTLIVLDDFNATIGTDRDGYEFCWSSRGSGSRDESSSMLLNFAKSEAVGSWTLIPEARLTPLDLVL